MKRIISFVLIMALMLNCMVFASENDTSDCLPCELGDQYVNSYVVVEDLDALRETIVRAFGDNDFTMALGEASRRYNFNEAELISEAELDMFIVPSVVTAANGEKHDGYLFHGYSKQTGETFNFEYYFTSDEIVATSYFHGVINTDYFGFSAEEMMAAEGVDPMCYNACNYLIAKLGCAWFCSQFALNYFFGIACYETCSLPLAYICERSCTSVPGAPNIPTCGLYGLPDCDTP